MHPPIPLKDTHHCLIHLQHHCHLHGIFGRAGCCQRIQLQYFCKQLITSMWLYNGSTSWNLQGLRLQLFQPESTLFKLTIKMFFFCLLTTRICTPQNLGLQSSIFPKVHIMQVKHTIRNNENGPWACSYLPLVNSTASFFFNSFPLSCSFSTAIERPHSHEPKSQN